MERREKLRQFSLPLVLCRLLKNKIILNASLVILYPDFNLVSGKGRDFGIWHPSSPSLFPEICTHRLDSSFRDFLGKGRERERGLH